MHSVIPNLLSIAGSDPSGGAGIQGDLKTFAALGAFGCAVPTALTAQNTMGIRDVWHVPADVVARQLETLLDDVSIAAVKIGMLGNAGVVEAVVRIIRRYAPPIVVLDPVLRASTGSALLDASGLGVLCKQLLPLVDLVTPNTFEAGALLGVAPPQNAAEASEVAVGIVGLGARAVLLTGGHIDNPEWCVDVLATSTDVHVLRTARVTGGGAHGSGCALSAAVATLLARRLALVHACEVAQRFVASAIRSASELRVGDGTAPVHVLGAFVEPSAIDPATRF